MNYRHAFHAGNHADVLKHALLTAALARLGAKRKPLALLDLFAGAGRYDLALDERAQRTGEAERGVGRIWAARGQAPAAIGPYLSALAAANRGEALRWLPGSPDLMRAALRSGDRLTAVEKHPEEAARLAALLADAPGARVEKADGWTAAKALTPPEPRRGLMLIDPPFEAPGEYDRLARALSDGLTRWATGVYLLWRPIKDRRAVRLYERALREIAGDRPLWRAELTVKPEGADGLLGSGVDVVNPPFGLEDDAAAFGPWAAETMAGADGAFRAEWLVARR